jgi:hypothetical protein
MIDKALSERVKKLIRARPARCWRSALRALTANIAELKGRRLL